MMIWTKKRCDGMEHKSKGVHVVEVPKRKGCPSAGIA